MKYTVNDVQVWQACAIVMVSPNFHSVFENLITVDWAESHYQPLFFYDYL